MQIRRPQALIITLLILTAGSFVTSVGTAETATSYDISVDGSVDVPTRQVELLGDTYNVSAVAKADPGDSVRLDVEAPSDTYYRVTLYNADKRIEWGERGNGSASFSLDLASFDSGAYMFAVQHQGSTKVIHPLVVRGYSVDVDHPDNVTAGERLDVTVTAEKLRGGNASSVEVVVANESHTVRNTASKDGADTYSTTVDTDSLSEGSYDVYANVRGQNTVFGKRELIGMSDTDAVTVNEGESVSTATPTPEGGASRESNTTTATSDSTATPIVISTATATPTPTPSATTTDTSRTENASDPQASPSNRSRNVVTPRPTTSGGATSTSSPLPGPQLFALLIAGLAGLLKWRRRA